MGYMTTSSSSSLWTLPVSVGFALILLTSVVFGLTLPTLARASAVGESDHGDPARTHARLRAAGADIMKRPPRDQKMPIFDFAMCMRTLFVSFIMLAGCYWVFFYEQKYVPTSLRHAPPWSNTVVAVASAYLINCRSLRRSIFSIGWFSNPRLWLGIGLTAVLQLVFTTCQS